MTVTGSTQRTASGSLFLGVRGAQLAYSVHGSGPLVLRAHGLSSSRAAEARVPLFDFSAVEASGFRVAAYDARGHGESEGGSLPSDYAWSALADDMLALGAALSPDQPFTGIGLSMGTATLLYAALRAPERFNALVLTAAPTAWETRAERAQIHEERARFLEEHSYADVIALYEDGVPAPIFEPLDAAPSMPDVDLRLLPAVLRGAGMSDLPDREELRSLRMPVLILAWATDEAHPVSTAEQLAQLIPGSILHVSETLDDIRTWGARTAEFLSGLQISSRVH